MSQETWGGATANKGGGSSDPNVMKLGDQNRVRLLDAQGPRKWRQHAIDGGILHQFFSGVDEQLFRSVICPRGADGTGGLPCPLDMKGSYITPDGKVEQLFPVSMRYAANVWDYESGTVKVLIAGKQIFQEFDAVAAVGFDPTGTDFIIFKSGKDRQTSYKVVRGGDAPLPREIKPEELHDLDKYDVPMSVEKIFETLNEAGVDYDAIPLPEFTLESANGFMMPYGKMRGHTLEQIAAMDLDYMKYIYGQKRDEGQYGDAVFQAMHTILLDLGEARPLDDSILKAPPKAATSQPPTAPAAVPDGSAAATTITLLSPAGEAVEVPIATKDAMLSAGFTEPAPPAPEPATTKLIGPDGAEVDAQDLPDAAVQAMLSAGYRLAGAPPTPDEPDDADTVVVEIGGTQASMPWGAAKGLVQSGAATLVASPMAPPEPPFSIGDDEKVPVQIAGVPTPIDMEFGQAKGLFVLGQLDFTGDLAEKLRVYAKADDKADDADARAQAQANAGLPDPQGAAQYASDPYDKSRTEGPDERGRFTHPALPGKDYATAGAVTQALNRLKAAGGASTSAPAAVGGSSAAPNGAGGSVAERAKALLTTSPYMQDFPKLMELFKEVSDGKRNISDFTEAEMQALVDRLEAEKAAA